MCPELSLSGITFSREPGILLYQESFFFQIVLGLNTLGINRLLLDSPTSNPG